MIREMQEADLADVMEIWLNENINSHDFIEEEYWKNKHSRMQDSLSKAKVFVWDEGDGIKGFIALSGNYIEGLFVKSEHQRQKIGTALLNHCKNIFWSLIMHIYQENQRAVNFCEKHDFFVRDRMNNAETNACELFMEWIR